jgi:hypothetical protein
VYKKNSLLLRAWIRGNYLRKTFDKRALVKSRRKLMVNITNNLLKLLNNWVAF